MIISLELISSMKDDIWYQTASKSKTLKTRKVKDEEVVWAAISTAETIFWMTDPSGAWRVIIKTESPNVFFDEVVNLGVVETLNRLRK